MATRCSRLAPSPTGALHLGNARTFIVNWALARREGWMLRMRVEDLDGPRIKAGAAERTVDILTWLGLDFDGPIMVQSVDLRPYEQAMARLESAGRIYACSLTRREIEQAATAPHQGEHELRYDPSLRPTDRRRYRFDRQDVNYRLLVEAGTVVVEDQFAGCTEHDPHAEVGDFVVWTKRGSPAYQLAVVVDDLAQAVTDVVRGDDLLPSAARQQLLYAALDQPAPSWWHLPLVVGTDGRRLAKRHGDTRLETYRERGCPPERIVGLLAMWCGVSDRREEMRAREFMDCMECSAIPPGPITFTEDDHQWLIDRA